MKRFLSLLVISGIFSLAFFSFLNRSITINTTSEKPNIIFIFTDDQTYSAVHALGNPEIITPNLDRLVRRGTSFTNASNMGAWNGAVCVASRAMIISGRSVWHARKISESWAKGDSIEKSWGQLMQQGGYTTYMTGKWHVDAKPEKVFNVVKDVRPGMAPDYWNNRQMKDPETGIPFGYGRPKNEYDTAWRPYDTSLGGYWSGGKHWNEVLREDAVSFIKTASEKPEPFFMYIASNAPHDPRQSPKKYQDLYPLERISLPKSLMPEYPYKDAIDNGKDLRDEALAPFPRTPYSIKKHLQEYYASITYIDEQIGIILDELEKSGKADNTYIFFTADHGLAIGRHGLMGKQSLFEHSVKPPLIIAGPGIPGNKQISTPVYLQDVMATALDVAGIERPPYVFFHSLLPLAQGKTNRSAYPAVYGSYKDVERSIKKDNFKLIVYPRINKVLLFDLKSDPEEMNDLSEQPGYKEKAASLFRDLLKLQKSMDDFLDIGAVYNVYLKK